MIKQYELRAGEYAATHQDDPEPIDGKLGEAYKAGYLQARHDAQKLVEQMIMLNMPKPLTYLRSHLKILGIRESGVFSKLMEHKVSPIGTTGRLIVSEPYRFPDEPDPGEAGDRAAGGRAYQLSRS